MSNYANLKFVIGSKPLSDNTYNIYLRITKNRKKKEIATGIKCKKEHFEDQQLLKKHKNNEIDNEVLATLKKKAFTIIRDFQIGNKNFSLEDFESKFRGNEIQNNPAVIVFMDELISEMQLAGRIGNANVYREAKDALVRFQTEELKFSDITPAFLDKFEAYMRGRGNLNSGISIKMRTLRAVFNKAIERNMISSELYPFKAYKISKLKIEKNKRALSVEDFKKIRDVDLSERPDLMQAYHFFLFSFYTCGMNFVDVMQLKWSDIQDGRIYYVRSKTKAKFSIEVTEKVQEILDFYKRVNKSNVFVFPFLLKTDLTPQQMAYRKHKVLSRINKKLKEIAELAGIEKNLTTYVARHSFATILKQIGTSTDVISELMGHSDVQVTMTYLKEFDSITLDKENRKLLEL